MTIDPTQVHTLLLDIEGTTTSVSFVYEVLFPYAHMHVQGFLQRHLDSAQIQKDIERLREEHTVDVQRNQHPPPWRDDSVETVVAYVYWLMERDRKSTGLKSLQGKIWEEGYDHGELRGQVYPDVRPAFERWRKQGRGVAIFSSGSVLAQKRLFGGSIVGDLTPFIDAYFDTTTGPKTERDSYLRIAAALNKSADEVLFLSDAIAEFDAAQRAGMQTALCVRSEESPVSSSTHRVIRTFDEICP